MATVASAAAKGVTAAGAYAYAKTLAKAYEDGQKLAKKVQKTQKKQKAARKAKVRSLRKTRSKGAAHSKSAGKITALKKGNSNSFDEFQKVGIVRCIERGGVVDNFNGVTTPNQVIYIGHGTMPLEYVKNIVASAILKKLLHKAQIPVADVTQIIQTTTTNTLYRIMFAYKNSPSEATLTNTLEYDFNAVGQFGNIKNQIVNWLFPSTSTGNFFPVSLTLMSVAKDAAVVYENTISTVDLKTMKVSFLVKSSMKIQNRTVNTEGNNESDDIDNVPLYGRSYEGPGNGAIYGSFAYNTYGNILQPLHGTQNFLINVKFTAAGSLPNMYKEVPFAKEFHKVTHSGKIHLEPGDVKTSVLTYRKTFAFYKLWRQVYYGTSSPIQNGKVWLGSYRLFCLEKMIQAVGTTASNCETVAYEIDAKMGCFVRDKFVNRTNIDVDVSPV